MKKVLFATTALVLSAGFAAAEVSVSGDGRMGFVYDGEDLQFASRARVKFTLTGETDSGLSFGGSFRVDHQDDAGGKANAGTAGSVYVSGTYGKLTMGDVASASEVINGDLEAVGFTGGDSYGNTNEVSYLIQDGNNLDQGSNALYEYSINGFNIAASMTDGSRNVCAGAVAGSGSLVDIDGDGDLDQVDCYPEEDADVAYSVAVGYDLNGYKLGLGYADNGTASEIVLSGEATFNEVTVKGIYQDLSDAGDGVTEFDRSYGLSGKYDMSNGVGVQAFWIRREFETIATGDSEDFDAYGIGASYDLGGGATFAAGIADSEFQDDVIADVGVKFTF